MSPAATLTFVSLQSETQQMDMNQITQAITAIRNGLHENFPEIQGVYAIIQVPHETYQKMAKQFPEAVLPNEPYIEFAVGTTKLIFTSDEAIMLAMQSEPGEGNSNHETSPESGTKLGQQ